MITSSMLFIIRKAYGTLISMTGYLTQIFFSLWSTHVAFWKRYTQGRVEPRIRVHVNLHPGHAHIGHTTLQPWLYYDLLILPLCLKVLQDSMKLTFLNPGFVAPYVTVKKYHCLQHYQYLDFQ